MKKLFFKFSLLLVCAAFWSCEEDKVTYSGSDFVMFQDAATSAISVAENDGTILLPVLLTNPMSEDVTVSFTVTDGTAVLGTDFSIVGGGNSVTIPAGQTSANIAISLVDDDDFNELRTFTIALTGASVSSLSVGIADLGSKSKTVSIANDDCPTKFTLFFGAISVEDVGYGSTPGTGSSTPAGACDILRVVNDLPGIGGANDNKVYDVILTPDYDGASTGTAEVLPTLVRPNASGSYNAVYSATGTYNEETKTITLYYSLDAVTASGTVGGNFWDGTNVITKP